MGRYRNSPCCRMCGERGHTRRYCPRQSDEHRAAVATSNANRACGYCRTAGHNRKGCALKRSDKDRYAREAQLYRAAFLDKLKEYGVYIGALVKQEAAEASLYMVADIAWSAVNYYMGRNTRGHIYSQTIVCSPISGGDSWDRRFNAPWAPEPYSWSNIVCVSPVHEVNCEPPEGWLEGSLKDYDPFDSDRDRGYILRRLGWGE